jgi:hypothetical protein
MWAEKGQPTVCYATNKGRLKNADEKKTASHVAVGNDHVDIHAFDQTVTDKTEEIDRDEASV